MALKLVNGWYWFRVMRPIKSVVSWQSPTGERHNWVCCFKLFSFYLEVFATDMLLYLGCPRVFEGIMATIVL